MESDPMVVLEVGARLGGAVDDGGAVFGGGVGGRLTGVFVGVCEAVVVVAGQLVEPATVLVCVWGQGRQGACPEME